jgi:hypothetical protein
MREQIDGLLVAEEDLRILVTVALGANDDSLRNHVDDRFQVILELVVFVSFDEFLFISDLETKRTYHARGKVEHQHAPRPVRLESELVHEVLPNQDVSEDHVLARGLPVDALKRGSQVGDADVADHQQAGVFVILIHSHFVENEGAVGNERKRGEVSGLGRIAPV